MQWNGYHPLASGLINRQVLFGLSTGQAGEGNLLHYCVMLLVTVFKISRNLIFTQTTKLNPVADLVK